MLKSLLLTLVLLPSSALLAEPSTTQPVGEPAADHYQITIDTSNLSPEMKQWAETKLKPVCETWYPKLVAMLPSDGYEAPRRFKVVFKLEDAGPPAYASGNQITCNLTWVTKNKDGEGVGSVVHEMVHVVQQYKFGSRKTPFYLQEGIPDYIRWYLYEPEKKGAVVKDPSKANYDKAYRVTANFLNYVVHKYDKDLIQQLNASIRTGEYTPELWKTLTGKTVDELNDEWKAQLPG